MEELHSLRIIFMGTPEFAVPSLEILLQNHFSIVAVITAPDKPAGRGMQLQQSPVKKFALEHNLKVLQPEKLKDKSFIQELQSLKADLQVVVAFRMLPEIVWNMPKTGTINLHASLLPQYRGAAPINWAIINQGWGASTCTLHACRNSAAPRRSIGRSSTAKKKQASLLFFFSMRSTPARSFSRKRFQFLMMKPPAHCMIN